MVYSTGNGRFGNVYVTDLNGNTVHRVPFESAEGGKITNIVSNEDWYFDPQITADGEYFYFAEWDGYGQGRNIKAIHRSGTGKRILTQTSFIVGGFDLEPRLIT